MVYMPKDPKQEALTRLAKAYAAKEAAKDEIAAAVAHARSLNVTWREIAVPLHMQQPHVVTKFKPLIEERRVVEVRPKP